MSGKFATLKHFRKYKTTTMRWNVGAMDASGKFQFDDEDELCEKLSFLVRSGIKEISLVPFSTTNLAGDRPPKPLRIVLSKNKTNVFAR